MKNQNFGSIVNFKNWSFWAFFELSLKKFMETCMILKTISWGSWIIFKIIPRKKPEVPELSGY